MKKDTMKSMVVFAPGDVRLADDIPFPQIGEYEALVKIKACGFCNATDFQIINNTIREGEGNGAFPTLLGHEASCEVIELGKKVRNIEIGDRYIRPWIRRNPGNGYSSSFGNMSQYGIVADLKAMQEDGRTIEQGEYMKDIFGKIPRDMDFVDAGVLVSLIECYSAVENVGICAGQDMLIYGAGPMGLGVMSFMRVKGINSITVVDSIPERLALARNIAGAERTINFQEEDKDAILSGETFDVAIDCVGYSSILYECSAHLKPGGKVVSMGVLKSDDVLLDMTKIQNNTTIHSLNFPYNRMGRLADMLRLIEAGKIDPKNYYSHVLALEDIHKAMELVRTKEALKVILTIPD